MSKHFLFLSVPLGALMLLGACTDDNYDLANVDTTTEIKVNDLIVPVNLGPVTLNSVIDLGDDPEASFNKEMVDGKEIYVYNYNGDFKSNEIKINNMTVGSPGYIQPNVIKVDLKDLSIASAPAKRLPAIDAFHYDINEMSTSFNYSLKNIDKAILTIDNIDISTLTFNVDLTVPAGVMADCKDVELKDVVLIFPKGMYYNGNAAKANIGTYNPGNGYLHIPSHKTTNGKVHLTLETNNLNFKEMGIDIENHALDFDSQIIVKEGEFVLTPNLTGLSLPSTFNVDIEYDLSSFGVNNFTGNIDYTIEGLQFEDAVLSDIPDFLNQGDTQIKLGNPQIYLEINNSCAPYNLEGVTNLMITPVRDKDGVPVEGKTLSMDEDLVVGYDHQPDITGPYKYAISPEGKNLNIEVPEYQGAEKLLFSELGNVLYGNGLPQSLHIGFNDPSVTGTAKKLPLGTNIDKIHGNYIFRAPIALADGSKIVYSGTEDDWSSDDLKDLYVEYLEITATVNSDVPLSVKLAAQVLKADPKGEKMGVCEPAELPANAKDYPITIKIRPDEGYDYISDIDGIFYEVWAISKADPKNPTATPALSPDQKLVLTNLKAKVSGKYIYKDKDDDSND